MSSHELLRIGMSVRNDIEGFSRMENKIVVHLISQRDQPYGSKRLCCEICGKMRGPNEKYTEELEEYEDLPREYVQCKQMLKNLVA